MMRSVELLSDAAPLRLAKDCFDIGIMIDAAHFRLEEWAEQLRLELDQVIEVEGLRQHRLLVGRAVLKVNVALGDLPAAPPTGFAGFAVRGRRFTVEDGIPQLAQDDPAIRTRLGPPSLDVEIVSTSIVRAMRFYVDVLGLEQIDDAAVRCGSGVLFFREGARHDGDPHLKGPGIRYLTLQVFDADKACAAVVRAGGRLGRAPINFADIARYGFVVDPDGNWIELSARTSVIAAAEGV